MKLDRPDNPLALAMLSMLAEGPMHPYEIASTIRERHGDEAIKIKFGSLYSVISQLVERDLIVAHETAQSGRRPEHTKYRLTPKGRTELTKWMRELIAEPVKEYPKFEAALCLMFALEPKDIAGRLSERVDGLDGLIEKLGADIERVVKAGLDRMLVAEAEYRLAMLKAERQFCRQLIPKIAARARKGERK